MKLTKAELTQALMDTGDNITETARILKVNRSTVARSVKVYDLGEVRKDATNRFLDECHTCIRDAVLGGNWQAAKFILSTKGRHLGYTTQVNLGVPEIEAPQYKPMTEKEFIEAFGVKEIKTVN